MKAPIIKNLNYYLITVRAILLLSVGLCGRILAVGGNMGGGTGTQTSPYLIEDIDDFNEFSENSIYWAENKYTELMCDIDLAGTSYDDAVISPYGIRIRTGGYCGFQGIFEGNGHVISNLHIDTKDTGKGYLGLFGYIKGSSAEVKNLGIKDAVITSGGSLSGILCGYNEAGSIMNCYVSGSVQGTSIVGGLCGKNGSHISNCYAVGSVTGNSIIGGLIGNNTGTINNCYSIGQVNGPYLTGGFCGKNEGVISGSFWDINTSGMSTSQGGYGKTTNQMHTQSMFISAGWELTDSNGNPPVWMMYIHDYPKLYWQPKIAYCGKTDISLALNKEGRIQIDVYSFIDDSLNWVIGGKENCQWITQIIPESGYLNEIERKKTLTIEINTTGLGEGDYTGLLWINVDNGDKIEVPISLEAFHSLPGEGTKKDPYRIENMAHFEKFSKDSRYWKQEIYTKLMCDLNLSGVTYTAAIIAPNKNYSDAFTGISFAGNFDGDNHVISHLLINTAENDDHYLGMFGYIAKEGIVYNLELEGIVIGKGSIFGSVCGANEGTLMNCTTAVKVSGIGVASNNIGGLCGYNTNGTIINCYVTGAVSGVNYVGGLCGDNLAGKIAKSDYFGDITCTGYYTGGLLGANSGTMINCTTTGVISGTGWFIGGVCGHNSGTISFSSSNAKIVGKASVGSHYIGGVCGYNAGHILNCCLQGDVSGTGAYVGGICGNNDTSGFIMNSFAAGTVAGQTDVGGICGTNKGVNSICYSNSIVSGTSYVGGVCGSNQGDNIILCYSAGSINGTGSYIGGFCGKHVGGTIAFCYSLANIYGSGSYVGGFCGENTSIIGMCYSAGQVNGSSKVGGFCGSNYYFYGDIVSCFWDTQTSGILTSNGGMGKTTAEMKNINTYLSAYWDFVDETDNGINDMWNMNGYPQLCWQSQIFYLNMVPEIYLGRSLHKSVEIVVYAVTQDTIAWTVNGHESCDWIKSITPIIGSAGGPTNVAVITINIDSSGLPAGDYSCELSLSTSKGQYEQIPLSLHVFEPVGLKEYSILAKHWMATGCNYTEECSQADWYVDGVIDIFDFMQLMESWLENEIIYGYGELSETFETGGLTSFAWEFTGNANWNVVYDSEQNSYVAKSGLITNNQISGMKTIIDTTGFKTIRFGYKVSSENNCDYLIFYIDGVEQSKWSGTIDWTVVEFPVTDGKHTFEWRYTKDITTSGGCDCVWIDDILISSSDNAS